MWWVWMLEGVAIGGLFVAALVVAYAVGKSHGIDCVTAAVRQQLRDGEGD